MAYVDHASRQRRAATIGTVATLHLVVGYALVSGFAANLVPQLEDKVIGFAIPATPSPKPAVTPDPKPSTNIRTAMTTKPVADPALPPVGTTTATFPASEATAIGNGALDELRFPTDPSPQPTLAARPAVRATPKGNPASWVSTSDYPTRELMDGNAGTVAFRLDISTQGRVIGCTVTSSSGHPGLDRATCAILTRRGRFSPASDSTGAQVNGSYAGSLVWKIPQ